MFKFTHWFFLFSSHSLFALTTLHVNIDTDHNPGGVGQPGDLRYCLNSMNQELNTLPDDYAIVFDFPMTITLNGILPIINNSSNAVTITLGNIDPAASVTIDGNSGAYSGFFIPMGNVTIQNMRFQNMTAKGGNGGDGISGGGGGMGAGGAIYAPQYFLNGANPAITLMNVSIEYCAAVGGNGGNYTGSYSGIAATGNEGGGGGGGFSGNGGSITIAGATGGGGGGGFGGDGGSVTASVEDSPFPNAGGGGGGGGGLGSRAVIGPFENLGNGGSDQEQGVDGNGYGLTTMSGPGGGQHSGSYNAGGGGGGGATGEFLSSGGGGGGSSGGSSGAIPEAGIPPGGGVASSGGSGADGGGGGGGGIVIQGYRNSVDGKAGSGGYGGGGGGGSGTGASDADYTVQGGPGGVGGGGGGGGVNYAGTTPAEGGNSLGGGGGGGGGPAAGFPTLGGLDIGNLGGGAGGAGDTATGPWFGGGGGGGGSGLGGAIFVDSGLNFTIQALSGIPTFFNTLNNMTQAGTGGSSGSGSGGINGSPGSALGDSIFLRANSSLTFMARGADDVLILGEGVAFTDDTSFGAGGATVYVKGDGTVIYNGTTEYSGSITVYNANFKVNGLIDEASIFVGRDHDFSLQRGMLSGTGTLSGAVSVNSGIISPEAGGTLTLGSLELNSAHPDFNTLGSLVHIEIDSSSTPSLVAVNGAAQLAGILEIGLDPNAALGTYTILTASTITGEFNSITFTGATPNYSLSTVQSGNLTSLQFTLLDQSPLDPPLNPHGEQKKNDFGLGYELYNQLSWAPSPSAEITGYVIYRDGEKIGKVDASTYTYIDSHRKKGVAYTYLVTASIADGRESPPVTIVITP